MTIKKVLIIDDNPVYTQLLRRGFSKQGIEVDAVLDPRDSVSRAASLLPDVIILDLLLPKQQGFEICAQLKAQKETQDIPIIFLSTETSSDTLVTSMHMGCIDYISKTVDIEEFVDSVIIQSSIQRMKDSFTHVHECLADLRSHYSADNP